LTMNAAHCEDSTAAVGANATPLQG